MVGLETSREVNKIQMLVSRDWHITLTHNSKKKTTRRQTSTALAAPLKDLQLFKIKPFEHGLSSRLVKCLCCKTSNSIHSLRPPRRETLLPASLSITHHGATSHPPFFKHVSSIYASASWLLRLPLTIMPVHPPHLGSPNSPPKVQLSDVWVKTKNAMSSQGLSPPGKSPICDFKKYMKEFAVLDPWSHFWCPEV